MLAPCVIPSEGVRLDVGRGVAVVDLVAIVASSPRGCRFDAGAILLAREEGRDPPELVAWRADVDGVTRLGGPIGAVAFDVPPSGARVRLRAVLRGERFIAAPLATQPLARRSTTFHARATSVFSDHGIAGFAEWIDVGVPLLVHTDPSRDHEPLFLFERLSPSPPDVLIVDAGPMYGDETSVPTEAARRAELAYGGARALSILLGDLPIAIATAPDDRSAIERLQEGARAALAASSSSDPLIAAVGQRWTTSIATSFHGCRRDERAHVPLRWPKPSPAMIEGGLLDDDGAGCLRIDELLFTNHPAIALERETTAALEEALAAGLADAPEIGPLVRATTSVGGERHGRRVHRRFLALVVAVVALLSMASAIGVARLRRTRD